MVRTQVYLTTAQHRALKKEARRRGLSMTEMLRRIVDEHFHEEPVGRTREGGTGAAFGFASGCIRVRGDIIEPVDAEWEAG